MSSSNRATLAQSPSPSSPSFKSKRKSWARKCERCCCGCIIYFPLIIVYGLTSWAVWVQATVGLVPPKATWAARALALLGILFFLLLNWSYTTAVFTDPGSPLTQTTSAYSIVPSADDEEQQNIEPQQDPSHPLPPSLTVKSTGEARYCKKCHTNKPDRTHHCSTCRRCVLKMDHHCPWLATCVGFRNYKPFLLFLIYTCLFCWLCFGVSAYWVWREILGDTGIDKTEQLMPVNIIILAVLAGIIGLVLTGFTAWHIYLAFTGQTTIESLEKTRYLGPLRKSIQGQHYQHQNQNHPISNGRAVSEDNDNSQPRQSFASQLREIHANAIPGVTRPEEGVPSPSPEQIIPSTGQPPHYYNHNTSPAQKSLRQNISRSLAPRDPPPYHSNYPSAYDPAEEAARERARYNAYLDELDTSKLPNAFHLGWRRNLTHVFGPVPSLWLLPICNTTGDGWTWEPSRRWVEAQEQLARERKARAREEEAFARERWETMRSGTRSMPPPPASGYDSGNLDAVRRESSNSPFNRGRPHQPAQRQEWGREAPMSNWNDIPDEYLRATK